MEKKEVWICSNCGKKYGNKPVGIATWHEDVCDICGKKTMVTEPRDFGGLKQSREIPVEHISKKMYPMGSNVNEELFDWACSELEILEDNQKKQVLRDVISQSYKKAREEGYELACKYLRDEYLEDRKRSLELRSEPKDVLDILGRVWSYKSKLKE